MSLLTSAGVAGKFTGNYDARSTYEALSGNSFFYSSSLANRSASAISYGE